MSGPMSMEDLKPENQISDMIWIQTICGNMYPVACHGRDPEEVAALAARDVGQPVKVVKAYGSTK